MAEMQPSPTGEWLIYGGPAESLPAESYVEFVQNGEETWHGKNIGDSAPLDISLKVEGDGFNGEWTANPQAGRFRGQELNGVVRLMLLNGGQFLSGQTAFSARGSGYVIGNHWSLTRRLMKD